jgi:hypothetical protein
MALNLPTVNIPESQVLGPYSPTNPQNGCSINDAQSIIDYLKMLPQTQVKLDIVAYSTEGSGAVDLKWLNDNCSDKNLPLQLTIEGFITFPQAKTVSGEFEYNLGLLPFTGTLAAALGRGLQGNGRPMVEKFLNTQGMSMAQLDAYYLCLKPVQDTITYTFSNF